MGAARKPTKRKPRRKPLSDYAEAYREVTERSADLDEEIPELDLARTTEEQLRLYQQAKNQLISEEPG